MVRVVCVTLLSVVIAQAWGGVNGYLSEHDRIEDEMRQMQAEIDWRLKWH